MNNVITIGGEKVSDLADQSVENVDQMLGILDRIKEDVKAGNIAAFLLASIRPDNTLHMSIGNNGTKNKLEMVGAATALTTAVLGASSE